MGQRKGILWLQGFFSAKFAMSVKGKKGLSAKKSYIMDSQDILSIGIVLRFVQNVYFMQIPHIY